MPVRTLFLLAEAQSAADTWSLPQIIALLQSTRTGQRTLEFLRQEIQAKLLEVFAADLTYRYFQSEDPGPIPEKTFWEPTFVYGFAIADLTPAQIYLHRPMHPFLIAWTLVHEAVHVRQGKRTHEWSNSDVSLQEAWYQETEMREYEAHLEEATWFAEMLNEQPDLVHETVIGERLYWRFTQVVVQETDMGFSPVPFAIRQHVQRVYIDSYRQEARGVYQRSAYAYEESGILHEIRDW